MEYERIDKVQVGVISPSKLRMKLLGAQHFIRSKEERSNSCRTSPSRAEEIDSAKSSLLEDELHEEVGSSDPQKPSSSEPLTENCIKISSSCKTVPYPANYSNNSSAMQTSRTPEEDGNNGYDSGYDNASTSSFEFHRGERNLQHPLVVPFSRNMPSKWNDAEKWLVSRQLMHLNGSKKTASHNQGRRPVICNDTKAGAPESISRIVVEKFSFLPRSSSTRSASKASSLSNQTTNSDECNSTPRLLGQSHKESSQSVSSEPKVIPTVQSVSMRDIGTEMTPIASQDPSRTGTPMDSTTPIRSPLSSIPSTPRRGAPTTSPVETIGDEEMNLSEKELKLKIKKEIVALGLQLGKTNIASWASKDELLKGSPSLSSKENQNVNADYEARAVAWEEAEKSKHIASFKSEEVKIQAWEGQQKAKFEAKLRKIESKVEQMKAHAHETMVERLAITRQKAEVKHATARAKMNRQAAKTANQVEQIRQTGRTPSTHIRCCNWFL